MSRIRTVPEEAATGILKRVYDDARKRAGGVANIIQVGSIRPEALHFDMALYMSVMRGSSELSRTEREAMAVVVSRANGCFY